jgi:hypothetical protein
MKALLKAVFIASFLTVLYVLAGYVSTPTSAATYNCVLGSDGYCRANSACVPSTDPCLPKSPTACPGTTYTCTPTPTPTPTPGTKCDCNRDSDCSSGQECDEGSSAGCEVYQGNAGLCKSSSGSTGTTTGSTELPEKLNTVKVGPFDIPTDPAGLAQKLLEIGIGLGALLATVVLIVGGFGVATSSGNPDNLEKAKKQITAAVAGLLFILMSVLILNIIGGEIIGIDFFK